MKTKTFLLFIFSVVITTLTSAQKKYYGNPYQLLCIFEDTAYINVPDKSWVEYTLSDSNLIIKVKQ